MTIRTAGRWGIFPRWFGEFAEMALLATFGRTPTRRRLGRWSRGFSRYAWLLASPVARRERLQPADEDAAQRLYAGNGRTYPDHVTDAVVGTIADLRTFAAHLSDGPLGVTARRQILAAIPDDDISYPAISPAPPVAARTTVAAPLVPVSRTR